MVVQRGPTGYSVGRTACGADSAGFWSAVETAAKRSKRLWIVSARFREEAAALGLWQLMESNYVRIVGSDSRGAHGSGRAVPDLSPDGRSADLPPQAEVGGGDMRRVPAPLDQSEGQGKRDGRRRRANRVGICVLEDPPVILQVRVGWGGNEVRWVDAENYGVSKDVISESPGPTSLRLAEWFIRAASALKSLGRCGWQSTAGSQAMHLFRSVYHETPILSHTQPDASALERTALFGGRCECFQLGALAGVRHLLDFRSLYPFLCSDLEVPTQLARVIDAPEVVELSEHLSGRFGIADVAISTDEPAYPYRRAHDVIYPAGRFWTVLCGAELQDALNHGRVLRVRKVAIYDTAPALRRYAQELYALRQRADSEGDKPLAAWIKRLMVALPGKFGQRTAVWEDIPDAESPWEWAEWYGRDQNDGLKRWRSIAGRIQRERTGGFGHGSVPAITCAINAAGRHRLVAAIRCAGWESVAYCDTDSLLIDDYGLESLVLADWVRPGEWGFLQYVESAEGARIDGVKRYQIGDRARCAGRPAGDGNSRSTKSMISRQQGIRESLSHKSAPADWREAHPWQGGPGRFEARRAPGGRVNPVELWEEIGG